MSKLQILIPQYNENEAKIKPMLDSIEMQQNIDNDDFEVIIGNDGSDTKLSIDFLKKYSFRIQYHYFEHGRLAATRQKLLDLATADYVMFCDADDMFMNVFAISLILQEIYKGFDMLVSDFLCDYPLPDGRVHYHRYHDDPIFVHGKVFNRKFLIDNEIKWHPELHEHQDSSFNILARTCSKKTAIYNIPFYMWKYNKDSISRKDYKWHLVKTWTHMIDSYECLVSDLQDRGLNIPAAYYAKYCLYATYYEMSRDAWQEEEAKERVAATYAHLAKFYNKHRLLIKTVNEELTKKIIDITKNMTQKKGKLNKMPPFEQWLNSILMLFKGGDINGNEND